MRYIANPSTQQQNLRFTLQICNQYLRVKSYIKRLKELEELALSYPGVEKTFAIQAGRELRVVVESEKISDAQSEVLAADISNRIQTEMTYPGQIKVTVIRETRSVAFAK